MCSQHFLWSKFSSHASQRYYPTPASAHFRFCLAQPCRQHALSRSATVINVPVSPSFSPSLVLASVHCSLILSRALITYASSRLHPHSSICLVCPACPSTTDCIVPASAIQARPQLGSFPSPLVLVSLHSFSSDTRFSSLQASLYHSVSFHSLPIVSSAHTSLPKFMVAVAHWSH